MGASAVGVLGLVGLVGLAGPARADTGEPVVADEHARVERVADNVYAILHDHATDEWPHGNTGVIVGRRSVFVIDSTYLPSRARADIELIRKITDKPVRFLATTHWHFDHNNGAIAYREAFPDVTLIAERKTARWLEINQVWWSRMSTAPDSKRRASLAELEAELAAGSAPFDAEERAEREGVIAARRAELAELETLVTVAPDRVFDGELRLQFEGTEIVLRDWGSANSLADVTVWLPRERVLFTGDVVVQSPLPFVGASWPVPWVDVLAGLERTPAAALVPGHGPVMRDPTYLRQLRTLFEAVLARVEARVREGRTLDQIQAELDLEDLRVAVPAWNGPDALPEDWDYVRTTLIERAWKGVRGQN